MLPVAFGVRVRRRRSGSSWHVARRYPAAPKRVPMRLRIDGRPGPLGTQSLLWLAPVIMAAVRRDRRPSCRARRDAEQRTLLALVVAGASPRSHGSRAWHDRPADRARAQDDVSDRAGPHCCARCFRSS